MTDSSKSPAVLFENVSFRYTEQSEWIIKDIKFSIALGEWVSIVGGNGSGKSTLIKLMNGLLMPSLGKVHVLGENIEMANLLEIRKCVGVIFQNPDEQIVGITVEEDIAFGLQNLMLQRDEIISRVDRMMKLLQLEEYRNRPVRTLSGGQKQLVAIAGVLAMDPKIIVFDESTSMLDPQSTIHLHSLMSDLHQQGFTVIHVTHHPEDIFKADRILVLNLGRLVFEGDVPTLMKQPEILQDAHTLPPFVVRFKESLYRRGIELSGGCKSEKELAKSIWEYISAM